MSVEIIYSLSSINLFCVKKVLQTGVNFGNKECDQRVKYGKYSIV